MKNINEFHSAYDFILSDRILKIKFEFEMVLRHFYENTMIFEYNSFVFKNYCLNFLLS
jgi:hypothetical protein